MWWCDVTCNYTNACFCLVSVHRLPRLRLRISNCSLLLIYLPRKDERLSRPWLTYSGWFTWAWAFSLFSTSAPGSREHSLMGAKTRGTFALASICSRERSENDKRTFAPQYFLLPVEKESVRSWSAMCDYTLFVYGDYYRPAMQEEMKASTIFIWFIVIMRLALINFIDQCNL